MQPFIHLGVWRLSTYGLCVATALFVGYAAFAAELRRRPLAGVRASVVMAVMAIGAVVGARIDSTLENLGRAPLSTLLWAGGFAFYGALIMDCIAALGLARLYRVRFLALSDSLAVPCALAYGLARVGCFLSGDGDYGTATDLSWGMSFPHGLVPTNQRVHPTPLYECVISLVIALALWHLRSPRRRPRVLPTGEISAWFLLWSGVARFLVEFIRRNPRVLCGLTDAQIMALISISVGIIVALRRVLFPRTSGIWRERSCDTTD